MHFLPVKVIFRSFIIRPLNQTHYVVFSNNHVFLYFFLFLCTLKFYDDYFQVDNIHNH